MIVNIDISENYIAYLMIFMIFLIKCFKLTINAILFMITYLLSLEYIYLLNNIDINHLNQIEIKISIKTNLNSFKSKKNIFFQYFQLLFYKSLIITLDIIIYIIFYSLFRIILGFIEISSEFLIKIHFLSIFLEFDIDNKFIRMEIVGNQMKICKVLKNSMKNKDFDVIMTYQVKTVEFMINMQCYELKNVLISIKHNYNQYSNDINDIDMMLYLEYMIFRLKKASIVSGSIYMYFTSFIPLLHDFKHVISSFLLISIRKCHVKLSIDVSNAIVSIEGIPLDVVINKLVVQYQLSLTQYSNIRISLDSVFIHVKSVEFNEVFIEYLDYIEKLGFMNRLIHYST